MIKDVNTLEAWYDCTPNFLRLVKRRGKAILKINGHEQHCAAKCLVAIKRIGNNLIVECTRILEFDLECLHKSTIF